jgi:hypothetical protein
MSSNTAHEPEPEPQNLRAEAQRWVRRRRILDTILGIQAVDYGPPCGSGNPGR